MGAEAADAGASRPEDQSAAQATQQASMEKPEAAVTLTVTVQEFRTEDVRASLDASLRGKLEEHYRLIDAKRVGDREQQAVSESGKENCTTEDCLRSLHRRLIADRLFAVGIAPDGDFTQVRLTLLRGEDKVLRSDVCAPCGLEEVRERMLVLLDELMVADRERPDLNAVAGSLPVSPAEESELETDEGFSLPWWVYVAAGVLVLAIAGGGSGGSAGGGGGDSSSESGNGSVGVSW